MTASQFDCSGVLVDSAHLPDHVMRPASNFIFRVRPCRGASEGDHKRNATASDLAQRAKGIVVTGPRRRTQEYVAQA
jgi:hypothetical protein